MDGYGDGREYGARWLARDHRPVGNTARGYAALSRARARDWSRTGDERYMRAFALGVARECRANLHMDAATGKGK